MPPNTIEAIPYTESKIISHPVKQPIPQIQYGYGCQIVNNMIGRLCIGIIVGICIAFAFRNGVPNNATNQHIVLCVIGVSTIYLFKFYNNCYEKQAALLIKFLTT